MSHPFAVASRPIHLAALEQDIFDVVVIGGGITGAGIAREAAMRGLDVALLEREDFAAGTSSRSSRLVHGGIRYLEHAQFHLVFESSRERRVLLRIAPHLVRPQRFLWPVYAGARVPLWKLELGLVLYDVLALFRNIQRHHVLKRKEVEGIEPALRPAALRGGATYYDAQTDDARLTLATARAAAEAGAVVANHTPVLRLLVEAGRAAGVIAEDALTGRQMKIAARAVVNATGPWSDEVTRLADPNAAPLVRGTKGVHIAVPRDRIRHRGALTMLSPVDGRVMFVIPAHGLSIVGTTDTDYDGPPEEVRATRDDIAYLLRCVNAYFPGAHLAPSDVLSAWAGVRPLAASDAATPGAVSREHTLAWTTPGLLTVTGGKLTTYRAMAAEAVDAVAKLLNRRLPRAPTDRAPLPGGRIASFDEEVVAASGAITTPGVAEHLVRFYGAEWRDVWAIVGSNPALAAPIAPGLPYIVAELHFAVLREMALTLSDLLVRRLHIAFETRDHGIAAAPGVARVVAPLLGWNTEQIERELARYTQDVQRIFGVDER